MGLKPGVHWVNGERCLMLTGADVRLYEVQSGKQLNIRDFGPNEPLVNATPVAGHSRVFVATQTGSAGIWHAERVERLTPEICHGGPLTCAAISPDGAVAATASRDGRVRVWETLAARELRSLFHPVAVTRSEFSPDGRRIATACADFTVHLWDVSEGRQLMAPVTHHSWIYDLVFSPDGRWLATASQDGTTALCDAIKGQVCYPALRHQSAVMDVDFSYDGKYLLTASRDGSARVWTTATGKPAGSAVNLGAAILDATFSPKTRHLALVCDDGKVCVWDNSSAQPVATNLRHDGPVNACQFNLAGSQLATAAADRSARIWDLVTTSGTPPGWFTNVVDMTCGPRAEEGENPRVSYEESVQAVRARLLSLPGLQVWSAWLQWFLADRSARKISPQSPKRIETFIEENLELAHQIGTPENFRNLIEAIWLRPSDGRLYSLAAVVLSSPLVSEEPDRVAIAEWLSRRALELEPGSTMGLWARASYLNISGEHAKAAATLKQAACIGSDDLYFWIWNAWFYDKADQPQQAADALAKAVEVSERLPQWEGRRQRVRQQLNNYRRQHGLDSTGR